MAEAIQTADLTCRYGRTEAVAGLSFSVPEGSLFALLGPNGAGKTTTIRMLMNMVRPSRGEATVLGVDTRRLGPSELRAIGYVSENQKPPSWMNVAQLLAFCRPLYPGWDEALCRKLIDEFDLPLDTKLSRLSRGMRVKAVLVSSLAYRPRLLVLDEPFSGLDPLVREDLIEGLIDSAAETTIFISSHDLGDIESFASHIGYLDAGRLQFSEEMASLTARFREVEVTVES